MKLDPLAGIGLSTRFQQREQEGLYIPPERKAMIEANVNKPVMSFDEAFMFAWSAERAIACHDKEGKHPCQEGERGQWMVDSVTGCAMRTSTSAAMKS